MTTTFITRRRVEFCETDLAGIVHFANFYRYMEQAEHEWFRSLGLKIHGTLPDGTVFGWPRVAASCSFRSLGLKIHGTLLDGTVFGWPRVAASCSFRSPARYDDEIEVRVTVLRRTARSLTTSYEFRLAETVLATGEMKTAYCLIPSDGQLCSADMPAEYAERLGEGVAK